METELYFFCPSQNCYTSLIMSGYTPCAVDAKDNNLRRGDVLEIVSREVTYTTEQRYIPGAGYQPVKIAHRINNHIVISVWKWNGKIFKQL